MFQSYGFECYSGRAYDKSLEAVIIGCNVHLPNGRLISRSFFAMTVAGSSEIDWTSTIVTVAFGNTALLLDEKYSFPHDFKSCQWISGSCNTDGLMYLDSCRVPTEPELQAVKACLARDLPIRSEEYAGCIRESGGRFGCDEQSDGSRIC